MKFRCLALCLFTLFILSVSPAHAFKFDVWISGTTLHEAYSIAKYQKFKLRKSDYSGTASQPLLSREYDDRLLDEPVEVVLFFTPVSKQLFRVYVTWNRANGVRRIPEEKVGAMYQELEQLLSSKYAKGASIISSTHEKSFECGGSVDGLAKQVRIRKSTYTIDLLQSVPCNWLTVTYKDTRLSKLNFLELKKKQQNSKTDYKRF